MTVFVIRNPRRRKRLALEISAGVVCSLAIAYWFAIPLFVRAQSMLNTEKNFPDPLFRSAVEEFMGVESGTPFTREEAAARTGTLKCSKQGITDLTGIEFFTGIKGLDCRGTQITSLTIPEKMALETMNVAGNQLASLDLTGCPELRMADVHGNPLTALDVSKNLALTWLNCGDTSLERLDITKNTALDFLACVGTRLKALDVSKNRSLTNLFCARGGLTSLDISSNPALEHLSCGHNRLESIDLSGCTELAYIDLRGNPLSALPDFSALSQLETVDLRGCDGILDDPGTLHALQKQLDAATLRSSVPETGLAVTEPE